MPLNIADAESSLSKGRIEFLEWQQKFTARWVAPLAQAQLALLLRAIPQGGGGLVNPQSLERVSKLLKGR